MKPIAPENPLRIIVAGSGRLGMAVLEPLADAGHTIVAVVQNGRRVSRWERRLLEIQSRISPRMPSPLVEATKRKIPVYWLEYLDPSEVKALDAYQADLLITCGFSIILPDSILQLPRIGCINVHTALLPKHRGPNPCAWVVHDGDEVSGVTIHVTELSIDTGAILAQETFAIGKDDTSMDVYLMSCSTTSDMIMDTVNEIAAHGFDRAQPQDESQATYDERFTDERSRIDWSKSAHALERLVRASHAYAPAWFEFRTTRVRVVQATVESETDNAGPGTIVDLESGIWVATGDGTLRLNVTYTDQRGGTRWPGPLTKLKPGMRLE